MSMYTSLTGLAAAQTDLAVTSNNIANVGTTGFKRSAAQFGDIIAASPMQSPDKVIGAGTALKTIRQEFTQGSQSSSLNVMDMSITGEGMFMVKSTSGNGSTQYTRNGAFSVNTDRFVVDSAGQALQVFPVNSAGTVISTGIADTRALRLPLTSGQPRATTGIKISLNLPSDSEVIPDNARYASPNPPYAFDRDDPTTYNQSTSTTVYDSVGNPLPAEIYYVRTSSSNSSSTTNDWDVHVIVNGTELVPSSSTTTPLTPMSLEFNTNGQLTANNPAIGFKPLPIAGGDALILSLDHGTATTQFSDPLSITSFTQDGFASGRLDNVTVSSDGVVTASFTNGQTQALGKVVLASFANLNGLKQMGDAHYTATGLSGDPILGQAGGSGLGIVRSGSLEGSNVDITTELVNLITAQRNFQANAKAIETDSTMTSAIINIRS